MYQDLQERAIEQIEKKRRKKKSLQIVGVIFGSISFFLLIVSIFMFPAERIFMLIPITALAMIYTIIHTAMVGFPFIKHDEISEGDIDLEVARIYRQSKNYQIADLSSGEILELRQLDIIREEIDDREDYV